MELRRSKINFGCSNVVCSFCAFFNCRPGRVVYGAGTAQRFFGVSSSTPAFGTFFPFSVFGKLNLKTTWILYFLAVVESDNELLPAEGACSGCLLFRSETIQSR